MLVNRVFPPSRKPATSTLVTPVYVKIAVSALFDSLTKDEFNSLYFAAAYAIPHLSQTSIVEDHGVVKRCTLLAYGFSRTEDVTYDQVQARHLHISKAIDEASDQAGAHKILLEFFANHSHVMSCRWLKREMDEWAQSNKEYL